eukprot:scaffold254336_cov32-Tisochrysis_lutea.AAC.1
MQHLGSDSLAGRLAKGGLGNAGTKAANSLDMRVLLTRYERRGARRRAQRLECAPADCRARSREHDERREAGVEPSRSVGAD